MVWLCENGVKKQIFNWEGETNVGAQCDWYCFDHVNQQLTGRLIEQPMFASVSLPPPVINNESQLLFSSDITVMEMKNLIKRFCLYLVYYISKKNLAKYLKNPEKSQKSLKNRKNLKKIKKSPPKSQKS